MQTIEEEPEEESLGEEELIRGICLRESLSKVQPRDRVRSVGNGWVEYVTPSGRLYYFNSETKEKSWKPPRRLAEGKTETISQSKSFSQSEGSVLCREWNSLEFGPTFSLSIFEVDAKTTNVGKILRTGILKTSLTEVNGEKGKKKWVKSYVVLTEFCILLTTVVGSFKKLFRKTKTPKPNRYYLHDAEVTKEVVISNRGNVYRLKTVSEDILFRSKNTIAAESWYQALTLVINNLKDNKLETVGNLDFKERERTNSFDLASTTRRRETRALPIKSVSLSDFSLDEPDLPRSKCLSDFFGFRYPTPPGWITIFDSKTQQFCYMNSITGKKWFRAVTDDGHPYFYEEGCERRAWLLPSIYLDLSADVMHDIRKSTGSQKSCTETHGLPSAAIAL